MSESRLQPETRVCVRFQHSRVAVICRSDELLKSVERSFRYMLSEHGATPDEQVVVEEDAEGFQIVGGSEVAAEDATVADAARRVRYEVVRRFVKARRDLLWFHAGAAAAANGALLFAGPWGRGKSTLVTQLCAQGWRYLSDDIAPVEPVSGVIMPFPQTPTVREQPEPASRTRVSEPRDLRKREIDLRAENIAREPVPICAVVFPAYREGAAELVPCPPATAAVELLQSSLNFAEHRDAAVGWAATLMRKVPAYRMTFDSGEAAARLLMTLIPT